MRASRLVSLLLLLQTRRQMTARELATALEVSVRTIYRDVESLAAAGVPVFGTSGHDGGYRLTDGYHTRLTGMTSAEAETLSLIGLPSAADQLGLSAANAAARLKLRAALSDGVRDRADRLDERFHLDAPSWYVGADTAPLLRAIADATWNDRTLRIRYRRWEHPQHVTRTVQPHGLVMKAGNWYLVARHARRFRTYRVARITKADVLPGRFERATDFDLATHWNERVEEFDRSRFRDSAVVRLSARGLERLPDLLPSLAPSAVSPLPDDSARPGWTRVEIPIEALESATSDLLRFGADAEVLSPEYLRTSVTRTLRDMSGVYDAEPDSGPPCHPDVVPERFVDMLSGGRHNSLGRTQEVVDIVLADRTRLDELFATMVNDDDLVRLRVGDALEKVCRDQSDWFAPRVDRLLDELGGIDQPSVQWHVAQMLQRLHDDLSADEARRATRLLQRNLSHSTDWIVLNTTMDVLTEWSARDLRLARWLEPRLERLRHDERKSVAKRADKRLADLARRRPETR